MKPQRAIGSNLLLIVMIALPAGASDDTSTATTGRASNASFTFATTALAVELQPALIRDKVPDSSSRQRPLVLPVLYIASAGLQAFDVYSTISVLERGGVERNPLMKGFVSHPATFIALKAGVAAASVATAERLWRTDRRRSAIGLMLASTFVMGVLAAHNATVLSSIR